MYLDTDVVLAELKVDDWLGSVVEVGRLDTPKTSAATCIEVQYAMEDLWDRDLLTRTHDRITEAGIELVPLRSDHVASGSELRRQYDRLNLFDAIHLGTAQVLGEPIVSTDSLYPSIAAVESVDPRELTSEGTKS